MNENIHLFLFFMMYFQVQSIKRPQVLSPKWTFFQSSKPKWSLSYCMVLLIGPQALPQISQPFEG